MIELRIQELLAERNMTQKELCHLSGLRPTTVSEMVRGVRSAVNLKHLEAIMLSLEIEDFNKLFRSSGDK
ncbi:MULTISPECIES: helix-turn-helix domain-containing protein [Lactococcus]|jgi:putative transcriptional regulator|uniref:Helix-turn-helix transcriptional regulator n=1 Tax=Lactococcus formosensis TaxID=1281486 RepID=A0A9Q8XZP7_9LACT|nr:helix-turn-helix transcriptional regulator [Lactococcus formosensis]USJ19323.1 helix-turn-helix transcriptional regulator [Lactococcus formosensis]